MITAARPTFEPARGGRGKGEGDLSQLSKKYSKGHNHDFRKELEEREKHTTSSPVSKKPLLDQIPAANLDDEDFEEESDDNDTAALLEQEQKAEEERIRMEGSLGGAAVWRLPLAQVKRRWDDDVVFKNSAKGVDDQKKDKRFVNDTLRSEFHKKFMVKYIK
ncbi:unnamed protein product [Nyctereutes procyonoides]|uniref:Spliceosome-associated protein CWC15 homolog n=1 Tax=Nyctereutes procyonoides TaxID=34880 RepID=A0A811ZJ01_NYCPR|nr:unnamed protein product [Nyctereutes procyonoides]